MNSALYAVCLTTAHSIQPTFPQAKAQSLFTAFWQREVEASASAKVSVRNTAASPSEGQSTSGSTMYFSSSIR